MNIISGSTHEEFAKNIAKKLQMSVTNTRVIRHPDSEIDFEIHESIREKRIFIIQSKNSNVNDNIMELLIMTNACKLASCGHITAVMTYFPYSRQTERLSRTALTSKLLANLMQASGVKSVITMDLHSPQIQGFFNISVDNLIAEPMIIKYIKDFIPNWETAIIVAPDAGGVKRASSLASKMGLHLAIIHTQKNYLTKNESTVLLGDVKERLVIIIDDMADSCKTLIRAVEKIQQMNASNMYAIVTHGVLSGKGCQRINESKLDKLIVTNTVPQQDNQKRCPKLHVIDVSPVFAEAIRRIHNRESVSYLFTNLPEI